MLLILFIQWSLKYLIISWYSNLHESQTTELSIFLTMPNLHMYLAQILYFIFTHIKYKYDFKSNCLSRYQNSQSILITKATIVLIINKYTIYLSLSRESIIFNKLHLWSKGVENQKHHNGQFSRILVDTTNYRLLWKI